MGGDRNELELTNFFKECRSAPPLQMFSSGVSDMSLHSGLQLQEQLHSFEGAADEYDDLVKSLSIEDKNEPA